MSMKNRVCDQQGPHSKTRASVCLLDRIQRYRSHHKKCEEQYIKFQTCQTEREHLHTDELQKAHVVDGKMIIKVQYQNRKKYIKLQAADFEEFISEVKKKFAIAVDEKIAVEDDSATEVDETVFAELSTVEGICFVIKDSHDNGASEGSPSTPLSSSSRSLPSVSLSSSDSETSRQPKRRRSDEEALQSSLARDLIKQILQTKPGGTTVLEEYEETGMLCDSRRRQMVNILAAHMVETERRIPQRITKEKYALGIVTLFPALKDPLSRKGYEHFYDSQSGSGFLAWRLKTIQRNTKLVSNEPKTQTASGGGPRQ